MTRDAIVEQLGQHLVRIVNMCRDGITDDEIRITAGFCRLPEWAVMRVAHDLRTLTPEQEERYQAVLKALAERNCV